MLKKLLEETNGNHVFMRLQFDSGRVEELDAYVTPEGWRYRTSADHTVEIRLKVIAAFHELY